MIYLDNAATTQMSEKALQSMYDVASQVFGNPSSTHAHGRKANQELRQARQCIATHLNTQAQHIFFTSGGTETINTALKGYALAHQDKGRHIITTQIEHHAVLHSLKYLEEKHGFDVTYLAPQDGKITADQVKKALRPDTIMVSIMHVNNETGQILPIAEIGQVLREHPAVFHVDAVQSMGKLPILPEALGIDFLSASAHKFHGPKGIGFLYANSRHFLPLLHGGEQESKKRASTENLPAIVAMATALDESLQANDAHLKHVTQLKTRLLDALDEVDYYLNSPYDHLPYVLNLGFKDQLNEQLLMQLDLAGFSVSAGSACTAGNIQPSHVLAAMFGPTAPQLKEAIRISFSRYTTSEDIDNLAQTLKKILGDNSWHSQKKLT